MQQIQQCQEEEEEHAKAYSQINNWKKKELVSETSLTQI